MRKLIALPHRVCDYNCMLSGLEDIMEQALHIRLPEYLLFIGGYLGFRYEIQLDGNVPRLVEPGYGVGRVHYRFLADLLGFEWWMSEGECFETAWARIKFLLDGGMPVVTGELDMFHLPYLRKFYHRIHVPFHYITLIGYDEEKGVAYAQDCSRPDNLTIPLSDLKKALNQTIPGLCKRNTYFWFDFVKSSREPKSVRSIIIEILSKSGEKFLHSETQGLSAMKRLINDFDGWRQTLSTKQYRKCLTYLVTYTCSCTPMPPQCMVFYPLKDEFLKHHAMRDRFASLLVNISSEHRIPECMQAAELFRQSGLVYQDITDIATEFLCSLIHTPKVIDGMATIPARFQSIANLESEAFTILKSLKG